VTEPVADPERQPEPRPTSGSSGARRAYVARNLTRQTILGTDIESADRLWAKFMGLMGRHALPPGAGLWLPDSNGIHMMFMRFPIDAVFLGRPSAASDGGGGDGGGGGGGGDGGADRAARVVVSVHEALPAWRGLVPLVRGAHGVLELPVGTIAATGTAVGDRIALEGRPG
jgi:uncharacterized membrane protein (UPF0127 family)